jgi:cyclopropane-fatty-acyl-phospholipid synthase
MRTRFEDIQAHRERHMKYLRGCFTDEILDVSLVTYLKPGAA